MENQITDDIREYEHPFVAVDLLLFTISEGKLKVLLVKRGVEPFKGGWALPGGFVRMNESIDDASKRELKEECGVEGVYLEQLYTFGEPNRDPRTRVISVAYYALANSEKWNLRAETDAEEAKLFEVGEIPHLSFDHQEIFDYGIKRLRSKLSYSNIAFGLLPDEFTLTNLQQVYEVILGKKMDKRNFRKWISNIGLLLPTGKMTKNTAHRPAKLYKFKKNQVVFFG